jgi:hypothetical protein
MFLDANQAKLLSVESVSGARSDTLPIDMTTRMRSDIVLGRSDWAIIAVFHS